MMISGLVGLLGTLITVGFYIANDVGNDNARRQLNKEIQAISRLQKQAMRGQTDLENLKFNLTNLQNTIDQYADVIPQKQLIKVKDAIDQTYTKVNNHIKNTNDLVAQSSTPSNQPSGWAAIFTTDKEGEKKANLSAAKVEQSNKVLASELANGEIVRDVSTANALTDNVTSTNNNNRNLNFKN